MRGQQALSIRAPQPSPSPSGPPVIVSTPVVVSIPGLPNTMFPFDGNVFSVLKGIMDSFGNPAQWVGISNLALPISVSYPRVPDIRNPGTVDDELPLRLDFQVAFNNQQGGVITVGPVVTPFTGTEGSVISQTLPFAASEDSGVNISFKFNGSNSQAQVIYVIKAQP